MPYITEECLKKLDTKQQTNTLLNLVWRDSASEEAFTLMASVCHTLMVQQRAAVPKVRQVGGHPFPALPPPLPPSCALLPVCVCLSEYDTECSTVQAFRGNESLFFSPKPVRGASCWPVRCPVSVSRGAHLSIEF